MGDAENHLPVLLKRETYYLSFPYYFINILSDLTVEE